MNDNSKLCVVVLSVAIICTAFSFCYWVSMQPHIGSSVVVITTAPYGYPEETTPCEGLNTTVIAWQITCTHCESIVILHYDGFAVHSDDIYKCYNCGFEGTVYQFDVDISRRLSDTLQTTSVCQSCSSPNLVKYSDYAYICQDCMAVITSYNPQYGGYIP